MTFSRRRLASGRPGSSRVALWAHHERAAAELRRHSITDLCGLEMRFDSSLEGSVDGLGLTCPVDGRMERRPGSLDGDRRAASTVKIGRAVGSGAILIALAVHAIVPDSAVGQVSGSGLQARDCALPGDWLAVSQHPLAGEYLGQPSPGDTAELFAPGVVSTCKEHSAAMFTPDGMELYFGRMFPNAIYVMKQIDGQWTEPEVAPFSGRYDDLYPFLSADGNVLVFSSNRPLEAGGEPLGRELHLWIVERTATGWSQPAHLDLAVDAPVRLGGPAIGADGTLYFGQRAESGSQDIFEVRRVDGGYGTPRNLGSPVNSDQPDHSPYVAPDGSYILFSSFHGSRGRSDLFVSFKAPDGSWTRPQNLGSRVNSPWKDEFPYVSADGQCLFFNSNRPSVLHGSTIPDGPGNVYWVDARVIEELRTPR